MLRAQRGFTLLETVVALGAMTTLAAFLLPALSGALHWNAMLTERQRAEATLAALADRFEAEEDSAWAIFTPPNDVFGQANADGHELDFFTRDAHSRPYFWAYFYNATTKTLQRYLYSAPGSNPVADGNPSSGITRFTAQTYPLTALQDSSTQIYSALYAGAALQPATVHFGFSAQPWIAGGNQITYVRVETLQSVRVLDLATQTAPSGFTVSVNYTPSPAPTATPPPPAAPTRANAMIEASQTKGYWRNCPGTCSNADWPEYVWNQSTVYRYYQSLDGAVSWTLTSSNTQTNSGISTPTGGDTPTIDCSQGTGLNYVYECSTNWTPISPPGTAGMDFSAPPVAMPATATPAPTPTLPPIPASTPTPTPTPYCSPLMRGQGLC